MMSDRFFHGGLLILWRAKRGSGASTHMDPPFDHSVCRDKWRDKWFGTLMKLMRKNMNKNIRIYKDQSLWYVVYTVSFDLFKFDVHEP